MTLTELVNREPIPGPWREGENIPWDDPGFSERMLREHLSQSHDRASRRTKRIEQHVAWIHRVVLRRQPARVLDLGCGPGLYTSRLARLGHECVGMDFSPASIAYACDESAKENLACTYRHEDVRHAAYGTGFGLVMLIFGQFNVFRPAEAGRILRKAYLALRAGGQLLLEPHVWSAVHRLGSAGRSWYSAESGLFSDRPHLCLQENFWQEETQTATTRFFIIDAATGGVARSAMTCQGYRDEQYTAMLAEAGYQAVTFFPTLMGIQDNDQSDMVAITARKPGP